MVVMLVLPYAVSLIITVVLGVFIGVRGIPLSWKTYGKTLLYYIPAVVSAIVAAIVVTGDDAAIVPAKIIAFFMPFVWSPCLIWEMRKETVKKAAIDNIGIEERSK
jgi:hypothetical protein